MSTPPNGYIATDGKRLQYNWVVAFIFSIQFVLVSITFPLTELFSNQPLFYIDGAYHWYYMKLATNLASMGNAVGYDPFFSAGHINGMFADPSGKLPAKLASLLSPHIDEILLYKAYVFTCATLAPLAITAAAGAMRLTVIETLAASVLGIWMWWVSYFHWYYTAGLVSYVITCYLSVLFVSLIIRYLEERDRSWSLVGLGAFGAIGLFWHQFFPIPVAIGVLAYIATNIRHVNGPRLLAVITVIPALSLLPNLTWLYAMYKYYDGFSANSVQNIFDPGLILRELLGILQGDAHGSKLYPLLLIGSVWVFVRPGRGERPHVWFSLLVTAIALELLAYMGAGFPPVSKIQPNRFAPTGYLMLCVPAARGVSVMLQCWRSRAFWAWRMFAGASLSAVLLLGCILAWETSREVTPGSHGRYGAPPPQVRPLGESSVWVIDWLKHRTSADSRILFETSLGRVFDRAHYYGYYAYQSQREFIGGPYPFMHFASIWDGWAFGKRIADIDIERMSEYLSLYNIGSIMVHSDAAKRYFDTMPGVRLDSVHGVLRTYAVGGDHSYFLRGAGRVKERGHNHVLITNIIGNEIILKYHYVPGMITDPPTQIVSVKMLDDPQPFVRILNPPVQLRLYMP